MPGPYGIVSTGFNRKTEEIIKDELETDYRGTISKKIDLDRPNSKFANQLRPVIRSLGQVWEGFEIVHNMLDPRNGIDSGLVQIAAMQGLYQLGPQHGTVRAQCTLDVGTYAAGELVAYVDSEPNNLWENEEEVVISVAGVHNVDFISQSTGPAARADAGTLNNIAGTVTGWSAITNAADSDPGTDAETAAELDLRRRKDLARTGSGTVGAIKAAVEAVDGVEEVKVTTNRTSEVQNGIPAHSHRVVIYDGVTEDANNDDVAQAIFSEQADGARSFGALWGTAKDSENEDVLVYFDRATTTQLNVEVHIESQDGVDVTGIKQGLSDLVTGVIGGTVVVRKLESWVMQQDGVDDLEQDLTVNGGTTNLTADGDERYALDTADIEVYVNGALQ